MKKSLALLLSTLSFSVLANPQFRDITKKDVENVTKEFGTNFSHTTVSAPETDGVWGVEVGFLAGQTGSPDFKKVVDNSGGDGKDFKNIYHAALMARAHFPFEIFAELSYLPEQDISDVTVDSKSFGLGWNLGSFLGLPLDVAIGMGYSNSNTGFEQDQDGLTPAATIDLETTSLIYWAGVSKTFAFVTPYVKAGVSKVEGDLKATAEIFDVSDKKKENVSTSGGYFAVGANLDFFFLRFGVEATQMQDAKRLSGKLSFAF